MVDFSLSDEQRMLSGIARRFLEQEIYPNEAEVDRAGSVPPDLGQQIKQRAIAQGLYAANFPLDVGGGGLDLLGLALLDRELGKAGWALRGYVGRPSSILMGCRDTQVERYLLPTVHSERHKCFALTEPGAGSDAMSIATKAVRDGDDYVLNGSKHFISGVGTPDFAIVFAVTSVDETPRGRRKRITAFLVDHGTKGFEMRRGPRCVSYRAYNGYDLVFTDCRLPADQILGDEGKGFAVAKEWLGDTRVLVASTCCGKAERVLALATEWAATRIRFDRTIGRYQDTSFKLADMGAELRAADLLMLHTAWMLQHDRMIDGDPAMAKLYCSETLGRVIDHALQIFGGMGLMDEMPIKRLWRDARIERIWEGTSEIRRQIISRKLLRAHEAWTGSRNETGHVPGRAA